MFTRSANESMIGRYLTTSLRGLKEVVVQWYGQRPIVPEVVGSILASCHSRVDLIENQSELFLKEFALPC